MPTFAIGDVHGCLIALETIYAAAGISKNDTTVFLGDYVDRGPSSAQVIDWILEMKNDGFITLRGNHEIMMMEYADRVPHSNPHTKDWLKHGGAETIASYQTEPSNGWTKHVPDEHWSFLEGTLPYYESNEFIFVHAGLMPRVPLTMQLPRTLFWQKLVDPTPFGDGRTVVCGHTAQRNGLVADYGHTICIDTCAYGGQWLTCLEVESGEYWQANQERVVRAGRLKY